MKRIRFSLLPLLLIVGLVLLPRPEARAQDKTVLPLVETFDSLTDGLPAGWKNESSGELKVNLAADPKKPKEGMGAWKISVPVWYAGEARVKRGGIPLEEGENYGIEVWLRGDPDVPVTVGVEKGGRSDTVYFSREFAVGPDWRRCVLEARAPAADPAAELFISVPGSGSVSVDGLRMVQEDLPVEPAPPAPKLRSGNLIYNSSFELGMDGWTMPEQVAVVKQECPDGESFARWIPNPYPLQARPFRARFGATYVISAYLRSQRPGAKVEVAAVEVGSGARISSKFEVTSEWKRYAFSADLPCRSYTRYFLSFAPAGEQHGFDVDAVQVEEAKVSEYQPAGVMEISTGLSRSMLYPQPEEILGVPVQIYAKNKTPEGATLEYHLEGFYGEKLSLDRAPVPAGKTRLEVPLRVRVSGSGYRKLVIDAEVNGETVSRAEANLTALPPLDPTPKPDSFFGAHGSLGTTGEWHAPTIAARAGIHWWRLHDLSAYTSWAVAEPEQDRYVWFDREVDALRSRGMSVLGVFARTPGWAGQDPGGERSDPSAWPPARIGDLADYVKQVTGHYKGRIAAYEIWNEPWAREFWAGTPEKYAELAKAAATAARQGDNNATLIGGSFWGGQPIFTDRVLAKGVARSLDAVSEHQYTEPETVTYAYGGKDQVTQWNTMLRGKLDLVHSSKTEVWNTEGGTQCPSFYSWLGAEERARAAARTLAKTLVLNKANGVKHFFYYHVWQEIGAPRMFDWLLSNNWSLLDYDGSPKPTLGALATCARNIDGADAISRVETPALKAYVFKKGTGAVIAAWSPAALAMDRNLVLGIHPWRIKVENLMGNTRGTIAGKGAITTIGVHDEPIYIRVSDTDASVVARALKKAAEDPTWAK